MIALVVPSCREQEILDFLVAWRTWIEEARVVTYVVEDGPVRSFALPHAAGPLYHLCWADAPKGMLDCISVRSPGCRQIGFFHAYMDGASVLVTLDDDVRPGTGRNAFEMFHEVLTEGVPLWVDPLFNYRSRGYPEHNVGSIRVSFHVGSFLTMPDVDGETQLLHAADFAARPPQYVPRPTVVPARQLIPVNGGACAWRRELSPYVHYTVWDNVLGYRRFEDIWMGVILKRLLDHGGLVMSYGPPHLHHVRSSEAATNARLEANAKRFNENFWSQLDMALGNALDPGRRSLEDAWRAIALALQTMDNSWANQEGLSMLRWSDFFS